MKKKDLVSPTVSIILYLIYISYITLHFSEMKKIIAEIEEKLKLVNEELNRTNKKLWKYKVMRCFFISTAC